MIYRSDMHRIQLSVAGVNLPTTFVWDTLEGGDIASENSYYHAGNMGPASPTGGLSTPTDLTATVAWSDQIFPYFVTLWNSVQVNASATVSVTPLNLNKTATVNPLTWTGFLIGCNRPAANAGESTIGYLSVVVAPNEALSNA